MRSMLFILLMFAAAAYADDFNPLANQTGATVAASRVLAVTPNDDYEFAVVNRAIYVGVAGNIRVRTYGGDVVTLVGIPAGALLPLTVKTIYSTGTTATDIQLWW